MMLDRVSVAYFHESTSGILRSRLRHVSASLSLRHGYAGQVAQDSLPCHYLSALHLHLQFFNPAASGLFHVYSIHRSRLS